MPRRLSSKSHMGLGTCLVGCRATGRRGVRQGWRAATGLGEAGLKDEAACGARISSEKRDSRDRRLGLVTSPRAERRWRC